MIQRNNRTDSDVYIRAAALGAVGGLRAMTAPALLSYFASRPGNNEFENSFLASPKVAVVLGLLAIGELIGDKLPFTPNRTETPGLTARIISGAVGGGSVCAARKKSVRSGIVIGALSAVAAAYAGQTIRREIAHRSGIPSAVLGVAEDAVAVGIGIKALENNS